MVALGLESGDDFDENFDARASGVELTTTVVGEDDALHACFVCEHGVLGAADAFEDDWHWRGSMLQSMFHATGMNELTLGDALEPRDVLP